VSAATTNSVLGFVPDGSWAVLASDRYWLVPSKLGASLPFTALNVGWATPVAWDT
jgi:hypothetical protein